MSKAANKSENDWNNNTYKIKNKIFKSYFVFKKNIKHNNKNY